MIFKLLDIALSRHEIGFALAAFLWDDDGSYRPLLGLFHDRDVNVTYGYLLFYGCAIDWDGVLIDDED